MSPRLAVVTGAAHGIGRACAMRLADDGCDVAILDIDETALASTAGAIEARGRRVWPLVADVREPAGVQDAFARIATVGVVDVLVNNVGQSAREAGSEFWRSSPETWRFVIEVTLVSAMLCARQVVPAMRERRGGRIVNMASDSALAGDVGLVDYASAKMGVIGFTRALARELAPFGVTVNAVAPGAIRTRAHDRLPPETLARVTASVPMGYVAAPEDVAHAVSFLASAGAQYVTGHTLVVDGGRWMI